MLKQLFLSVFTILLAINFSACKKENPDIPNEEELITNLNFSLTSSTGEITLLTFQDLDGDGGDDPIISAGSLSANETYTGTIQLLNDAGASTLSITEEIETEAEEHQFFYKSTISDLGFQYNDQDANGNPIGLNCTLTTGSPSSGTITITLRHEPSKNAAGVSDNDITNAGGETDIEVTFDIDVQ